MGQEGICMVIYFDNPRFLSSPWLSLTRRRGGRVGGIVGVPDEVLFKDDSASTTAHLVPGEAQPARQQHHDKHHEKGEEERVQDAIGYLRLPHEAVSVTVHDSH